MEERQSWDDFVQAFPNLKHKGVIWKTHWECCGLTEQCGDA